MKEITKKVYYCEHCGKHGLSKPKMIYHENICFNNPVNFRPCFGCHNLTKKESQVTGYYYNGSEWIRKVDVFYCKAKDIYLHTPQNQIKENAHDLDDGINEPMPKECELHTFDDLHLSLF